jgi:excisionase family DNA binding protein
MSGTHSNERLLKFLQASPEQQALIDRILNGEVEPAPVAAKGPLLLGMGAGANLLGVSRATLWRMIQAGRLSKVEVLPGSFRVRRADVEAIAGKE